MRQWCGVWMEGGGRSEELRQRRWGGQIGNYSVRSREPLILTREEEVSALCFYWSFLMAVVDSAYNVCTYMYM